MSDAGDGTRFVDPDDLAKAAQLILEGEDARQRERRRKNRPDSQFTLASAFVFTFFVCLGLSAGGDWVPASAFAGIMGFLAIVTFAVMVIAFPSNSLGRLVWIGIALAYLLSCIAAVWRMNF